MSDDFEQSPVSKAVNHLGLSLLKSIAKEDKGNVFISPFSLSTALAMLHFGSRKETSREMRHVLGYEDAGLADDQVATAFSELISSFEKAPNSYILSSANSLLTQKKFRVKDEYKKSLQESFRATLFEADFEKESQKAVNDINQWAKRNTNGMIPQVLDSLDTQTVMVLLNAIYFKGKWMNKFREICTKPRDFYNRGLKKNAIKVQMMQQKDRFGYAREKSFDVLKMPYMGEDVAMMIFLPHSLGGIEELQNQLTPEVLTQFSEEMPVELVNVSFPRFRYEYSKCMKDTLQALGLRKVFEQGADLGGMSASRFLSVTHVYHKAVIEVNERGTVAAAMTIGNVSKSSEMKERISNFVVDRPFLFSICDLKDGVVLFLGKIIEIVPAMEL